MQSVIYISGPMSGYEELNFPAFAKAAERLRSEGHRVISPAEILIPDFPQEYKPQTTDEKMSMWAAFMREDIKQLMNANLVAVLPGWEKSKGACIEVELARNLGMNIVCATTLSPL